MKRCPACNTTYTDESLSFCLTDGTALTSAEEETVIRSAVTNPLRVEIPRADTTPSFHKPLPETKSGFPIAKILLPLVALGIVAVGLVAIAGLLLYLNTTGPASNQTTKQTSPTSSPISSPTIDPEKQRLQDELANMQKKLDEQKNANHSVNMPPAFPTPATTNEPGVVTARVNSPADGFLAMRSAPSAGYGDRVAKIPHGAVVNIQNCQRERVRIGARTGRWCMVTYGNNTGWVFDAWLDY
jgi:SH3 domain-containing protein